MKSKRHPNKVLPGDILVCDHTENIEMKNDLIHCAMYIGYNQYIESLPLYGVRKLHKFQRPWIWNKYQFFYVKKLYDSNQEYDTKEIIYNAINWARDQEYSRYQYWHDGRDTTSNYDPNDPDDDLSQKWICSELLWAAYMNASKEAGIDKDNWINITNSTPIVGTNSQYSFVSVYNLLWSGELQEFKPKNPPIPNIMYRRVNRRIRY